MKTETMKSVDLGSANLKMMNDLVNVLSNTLKLMDKIDDLSIDEIEAMTISNNPINRKVEKEKANTPLSEFQQWYHRKFNN
ncbi:MAG: hypothetical protein JXR07_04615 [Reichenbachiella sp.]